MACWGEGVAGRGVEGTAACVVEWEPEDAAVALYRAVRLADHQKGVG